jgi:hypothetical protein
MKHDIRILASIAGGVISEQTKYNKINNANMKKGNGLLSFFRVSVILLHNNCLRKGLARKFEAVD